MDQLLSDRIRTAKSSGTVRLAEIARRHKEAGHSPIDLAEGEPDFKTPDWVLAAASQAAQDGLTRYTSVPGTSELRRAILNKFTREQGLTYEIGEVMASGGAKQVIFNAMFCTLNPEDEVIIPSPYWVSYPDITQLCDGQSIIVECQQSDKFKIRPEQLRRAISTKTKWLILNSPNNPTGAVYSQEELRSLSKVLLDHPGVLVLCDDIYEHIVYDSNAFTSLAAVEPRLKDRTLIVNGVSKVYAMTGWRIGYSAGPNWLISAMTKLQGQSTTCPSSISQSAAAAALQGDQNIIVEWREIYRARRDCVARALQNIEGLNAMVPDGGFYLFVDCNELIHKEGALNAGIKNDIDLVEYLLQSTQVVLVPGSEFGLSNYFRLCFAHTKDVLTLALEKISNACKRLN